jgi:peptidyl-prolyl cis-trans isomerase D
MFDFVRSHTKLLQFLLVLLIFPSFVFFGIQGYSSFTEKSNTTVAKVGGADIKQAELDKAHGDQVSRMKQQMPGVDSKLFDTPEMKSRTLESLVRERVLRTAVVKENLVVTDDQLLRMFRTDPQFESIRMPDGSVNKEFLAAQGLTSEAFDRQLREGIAKNQVLAGVSSSLLAGQTIPASTTAALLQQREVQVQPFMASDFSASVNPTEADVEAYYKDHQSLFHSEEDARIEYVVLDLAAMKKQVPISEEELKKHYADNINKYKTTEDRQAAHILVNAPEGMPAAEREKAKAKATALLAEVRKNPASFGDVAKKNSDDPGSAANGGVLDFFGPGAMVAPFQEAAFKMKPGEISDLVETTFGYHIIKLIAVRGGEAKPFETVRAEIFDELSKPKAQAMYAAAVDTFNDMVFTQPDSLQPVIDKFKLTKVEAVVTRKPKPGATGPLASTKLLDGIFSTEVVRNKRNTDAVDVGAGQMVSARIIEHHPERVLPLAEVRERVTQAVKARMATEQAKKEGEARVAALKKSPSEVMSQPAVIVSRTNSQKLPREVVDAILRVDISKGPAVVGVDLGDRGYAVARVAKVVERAADDPKNVEAKNFVTEALSAAETGAYYDALKRRYKVKIENAAGVTGVADAASAAAK